MPTWPSGQGLSEGSTSPTKGRSHGRLVDDEPVTERLEATHRRAGLDGLLWVSVLVLRAGVRVEVIDPRYIRLGLISAVRAVPVIAFLLRLDLRDIVGPVLVADVGLSVRGNQSEAARQKRDS